MPTMERIRDIKVLHEKYNVSEAETITAENYKTPLTEYELPSSDAICQFLRQGSPCGMKHQIGFVVQINSGQNVLIGHCCAYKRLGLERSGVKEDLSRISKQQKQYEKQERIRALLANKAEYQTTIRTCLETIKEQLAILPLCQDSCRLY